MHSGVDRPHPPVVVVVEPHSYLVYYLRVVVSLSVSMRHGRAGPSPLTNCRSRVSQLPLFFNLRVDVSSSVLMRQ
jgi:hypothetical protein